jgi:membrane protease subunit HflK
MAWNNQGGPWGGGKSPWNRGSGPSGGGGNRPPDFEQMLKRGQDRMRSLLPGGFGSGRGIALIAVAIVVIWAATGLYTVNPGEIGVNLVFGKIEGQTDPGLHWNPPAPFGQVYTPAVAAQNSTEIGYRGPQDDRTPVPDESLMLTKDENIIDIQSTVQWRIRPDQVTEYLFQIEDPEGSVKNAVESAIREIIGQSEFQTALTSQKAEIASKAQVLAQKMLDSYRAGIDIDTINLEVNAPQEVVDAFLDVQRASNDAQSSVNDAQAYSNKVVQTAQGQAVQIVKEAEAYKAQKIATAQGDAQRFLSVYEQYRLNPAITQRRLYLESMQSIFAGMNKVLVDPSAGNVVPYLPLDQLMKKGGTMSPLPMSPPAAPAPSSDNTTTTVQPSDQQGATQ